MRIKPSEEVFALIKSLTRTEKAYFKKLHSGRSNSKLSKAFDRINSFSEYDEQKLNADLEKYELTPNTAYKQLLSSIMKALIQYDSGKTAELKLQELLTSVSVMFSRDRFNLALSQTEKGIALAKKEGFLAYEWIFLNWWEMIYVRFSNHENETEDSKYAAKKEIIDNLSQEEDYNYLLRKTTRLLNADDRRLETINKVKVEILKHPIIQKSKPEQNFRTQHYIVLCASYFFIGKWEEAAFAGEKGIFEEPELQKLERRIYLKQIVLMLNLCNVYQALNYRTKYLELKSRIISELQSVRFDSLENFVRKHNDHLTMLDLLHQRNSGKLNLVTELCDNQLDFYSKSDTPSGHHAFLFPLKIGVLFLQTNYKECQALINEFLVNNELEPVQVNTLRWVELLCTYHRKQDGLFESRLRAQKRFITKNPSGFNWENAVLSTLQNAFSKDDKEQKELFKELDRILQSHKEELRISIEFEINQWVKSVATGKPMIELIKAEYRSN